MTHERMDRADEVAELLRDLQTELAVEPSPAFAAGVRQRIAAAPARRRFQGSWMFASAVAAAAVVIVLAGAWWWTPRPSVTFTETKASRGSAPQVVSTTPAMAPAATAPVRPRETPKAAGIRTVEVAEVLIAPDQLRAVRRLMAIAREARTGVPPGGVLMDEQTGELMLPELKEIPPIVILPLPGSDDGRSGGSRDQ